MLHFLSFASFLLNTIAFVLLLLVTLSGLVIKGIYLVILPYVHEFGHDLRTGVLGFCQTDYGIETVTNCYGPHRGYTIPLDLVEADGLPLTITDMVDQPLTSVLILHPICAGLAVLCAIFSLFNTGRLLLGFAFSLAIWNSILVGVAFGLTLRRVQGIIEPYGGSAPWITLAAAILIWISMVLSAIKIWKCRRNRRKTVEQDYSKIDKKKGDLSFFS
ncbi:hypothetical protein CPB84DRAFT_1800776 [Gymnopilus junonius]|uniref:Uncharacterized protein n=1 Tax=Gymnopilus junonius TaxID=109634 RepID=A0A9P5TEU6_GYMJU|nr:hypothetical protein CPB84DRAFT_1800776 [Gymnopilus junonius]